MSREFATDLSGGKIEKMEYGSLESGGSGGVGGLVLVAVAGETSYEKEDSLLVRDFDFVELISELDLYAGK